MLEIGIQFNYFENTDFHDSTYAFGWANLVMLIYALDIEYMVSRSYFKLPFSKYKMAKMIVSSRIMKKHT